MLFQRVSVVGALPPLREAGSDWPPADVAELPS